MTTQRILLADATSKTVAYRGLSIEATQRNDLWLAVHAQTASDLAFTRSFCLQNAVPESHLGEAAELLNALDASADPTGSEMDSPTTPSCQETVELFRGAIATTLPDWAVDRWATSLPAIHHLPTDETPDPWRLQQTVMDRFAGDDPDTYLLRREEDRRAAIEDYEEAVALDQPWNAVAAMYAADTAAFDMWLLQRSLTLGDPQLTQYEMLWRLASYTIDRLVDLPEDPQDAMFLLRVRLVWVVGPHEAENLKAIFHAA